MIQNDPQNPYGSTTPVNINVNNYGQELSPTVTKTDWLIWIILTAIPVVNVIMFIVYACDSSKPSRANLAKVSIILVAVAVIVLFLIGGGGALAAAALAGAE